jgi:Fe-S cluster biogenesis protein NfuA
MIHHLEKLFDQQIRPALAQHGGNVEIVDVDNDILYVKFFGGCQGCSSSKATLKGGIEQLVKKNFPEIKDVQDITDHNSGQNPYM